MTIQPPPAILVGGANTALSVARSLSAAGIAVYGVGGPHEPLRYSRDRRAYLTVPGGDDLQERYLDRLARGPRAGIVLPCSDDGLELIARNRAHLQELGYGAIEANDEVALAMLDKERTFELAVAAGVEAPWVGTVTTVEAGLEAAQRVGYPCALKPRHSHRFSRRFAFDKAFVVDGPDALAGALRRTLAAGVEMMVAEIVPGPDAGICSYYGYLDQDGNPLMELTKRKPRQYPPKFGIGCFHVTDRNPEVAELGLRFCRGVGLRGLGNVEFKRDVRDGRLKLIECNHRFTLPNEQLRRCGADFALLAYRRAAGLPTPPSSGYRTGVGLWYPVTDLRAFFAYRRLGELTWREWLASLRRPLRFPAASIRDPLPSLATGVHRLHRRLTARRRA